MTDNNDLTFIHNLLQAGRHAEAEQRLQEICAGPSADAESWFILGALSGMRGDAAGAERIFRKVLTLSADFPQAQFNLGIALRDQGRLNEARSELEAVVAKQPQHADAFNALGYVNLLLERHSDAERCFRAALASNPGLPDALTNLGSVLASRACWAEAVGYHRRALVAAPNHDGAAINLGGALVALGRIEEAISAFRQAISAKPENAEAHARLGVALMQSGKRQEAELAFQQAIRILPGHSEAQYFLAMLGTGSSPKTVPPEYVARLFDGYADSFDAELVGKLQYRTPEVLFDAVRAALADRQNLDILDLGCGTGLCGMLFKPLSRRLIGVDISSKMIAKAHEREIYDELETGELTVALLQRAGALDVVLAADVFVYVGDLDPVFQAAAEALRPAGIFAFSVESETEKADEDYVLRGSGRYAHTQSYLEKLSQQYGFVSVSVRELCIRMDFGKPITGTIYVMRREA